MFKATGAVSRHLQGFLRAPLSRAATFTTSATGDESTTASTRTATVNGKPRKSKLMEKFKKSCERPEFRARDDIYLKTINRLARSRRFPLIREFLEHQKSYKEITEEAFTSRLIKYYSKARMFDDARKLFDEMPQLGCPRTVLSFSALLSASVNSGRFDEFNRILEEVPGVLGITMDVVTYNVAINGFCKMGDFDKAVAVLDEMVEKGVQPSLVTFNTLLHGLYENGRFEEGEKMWDRMVGTGFEPDIRSYNAKLLGLVIVNKMEEATQFVGEMKGIKPDTYSFNALFRGYVRNGNLEETKKWYGEMRKEGCNPDEFTSRTLLNFLSQKGVGDLGFALEVCNEILGMKCPVTAEVLQLVVDRLVEDSRVDEAQKLVRAAKRNKLFLTIGSAGDSLPVTPDSNDS